jgi:hypothetical protein
LYLSQCVTIESCALSKVMEISCYYKHTSTHKETTILPPHPPDHPSPGLQRANVPRPGSVYPQVTWWGRGPQQHRPLDSCRQRHSGHVGPDDERWWGRPRPHRNPGGRRTPPAGTGPPPGTAVKLAANADLTWAQCGKSKLGRAGCPK